jgi:hypothetical protein
MLAKTDAGVDFSRDKSARPDELDEVRDQSEEDGGPERRSSDPRRDGDEEREHEQ